MRIVVIRTSALGDTVLTTPLLRELHLRLGARVELVTHPAYVSLFQGLPFLGRVWGWGGEEGIAPFAEQLRKEGPIDLAVDLQNKPRTFGLLMRLGARQRSRLIKRKGVGGALFSLVGAGPILNERHAASFYFGAVSKLGVVPGDLKPEVSLEESAVERAGEMAALAGGRPLVALAPGARWALKRWGPAPFARVGDALAKAGASLLLVGGPGDERDLSELRASLTHPPIADTLGMDLPDLAAILARAELLVTGDSGPSHLAQAVGTPVVSVFGPTSWKRWGPVEGGGAVVALPLPCSPCSNYGKGGCAMGDRACLDDLPAEAVIEVALATLGGGRTEGAARGRKAAAATLFPLAVEVSRRPRGRGKRE